jgi:hypothetical protein
VVSFGFTGFQQGIFVNLPAQTETVMVHHAAPNHQARVLAVE